MTRSTRWALAGLSFSMLLSSLGTSIANVALPTLALAFNASFAEVQWVVVAYLLAITIVIVSAGRLGDIVGRRRLLLVGITLFTLASILCGIAPTLWLMIAARAAQGVGAAIMMALSVALVSETIPKGKTGSAMGLLGTMSAIGTALGPSMGGLLIGGPGWPAIFFVNVPLGAVTLLIAYCYLPPDSARSGQRVRLDIPGTLLLAVTLAAYALAMTMSGFGPLSLGLLVAAAIGAVLFVLVETRAKSPLIQIAMFGDRRLSAGLAAGVIVATVMMASLVVSPFYLSRALGLNAAMVGLVMSIGPATSIFGGVVAGRIVDRLGASTVVIAGLVEMAIGAIALALLPPMLGIAGYIVAIIILTPGYQLFQAANNTAVMTGAHPDRRGVISGMLNLSRNLGLVTGASAMGALFALAASTVDVTTGMQITFATAAVLIVAALAILLGSRAASGARAEISS